MKRIRIGRREIGPGRPCYIIAEAGSNHNRSLERAKKLVAVAAAAGADAVKFQVFRADALYSRKTPKMAYLKKISGKAESVWDILKGIEMPRRWLPELATCAKEKGLDFLATPFDLPAVDALEAVGVKAYKIASFEIVHLPLVAYAASKGKPLIISTGMADMRDVRDAVSAAGKAGNKRVALLHCAIGYPPAGDEVNLRAMETMRRRFGVPVGFSDHTPRIAVPIAAVAMGACIVEKHYTLSRKLKGPDHPFALEPEELSRMVGGIREAEAAAGSPVKRHTKGEEELHRLARRSVVAAVGIPAGARIRPEMIEIKRPGFGIAPRQIPKLLGRRARKDIEPDEVITWDMIEGR